jgi:hypothetical protein
LPRAAWNEAEAVTQIGDLHFVPLVRESLCLTCELDILFLREGEPGVMERGQRYDIDNRLKLFERSCDLGLLRLSADRIAQVLKPA